MVASGSIPLPAATAHRLVVALRERLLRDGLMSGLWMTDVYTLTDDPASMAVIEAAAREYVDLYGELTKDLRPTRRSAQRSAAAGSTRRPKIRRATCSTWTRGCSGRRAA